jgi:hypothetical protein
MKDLDRALGIIHVEHFHEGIALGAVGVTIVDDLDVADAADAFEEIGEVAFADVVGEISDVEAGGFHWAALKFPAWGIAAGDADIGLDGAIPFRFAGLAGVPWAAVLAFAALWTFAALLALATLWAFAALLALATLWAFGALLALAALWAWGTDGFLVEADGSEDLLPEGQLDRWRHAPFARASVLVVASLAVGALWTGALWALALALAWWAAFGVLALAVTVLAAAVAAAAFLSRITGV